MRNAKLAELAAHEMGGLALEDAYRLLELYAEGEPLRFERAARRWLVRFLEERKPPIAEAALAAAALAELRHGVRGAGRDALARLVHSRNRGREAS